MPEEVLAAGRVGRVVGRLVRDGPTVEDLATEYGYRDASSLSREVLRCTGMRPGAYRSRRRRA